MLERLSQWHAGIRMFQDNYLTGVGVGNYDAYYPEVALPNWQQPLGHAHNLYLNIAAESGLLGLGAYLVLVLAIVCLGRRALHNRHDRAVRALAVGILGGLRHTRSIVSSTCSLSREWVCCSACCWPCWRTRRPPRNR